MLPSTRYTVTPTTISYDATVAGRDEVMVHRIIPPAKRPGLPKTWTMLHVDELLIDGVPKWVRFFFNGRNEPVARLYPYGCEWFLRCDNVADRLVDHPLLGGVPTCERCAARAQDAATA